MFFRSVYSKCNSLKCTDIHLSVQISISLLFSNSYLCLKESNSGIFYMKTHIIRRALLALGICSALNMQAQAPHPERIYLSGTGTDYTRTWEFYCSKGQNSGKWKSIEVPSCWELQGFGEYTYGRYYTIKGAKPSDETGIYRYRFLTPDCGKTDRVKLFFDGVMTDAEVWVNGKSAGQIHQGAFYRFSYDITSLLKAEGENLLEVKVAKQSANKSVNAAERRADWWLYGGIYRPVWLEVVPAVSMEHFILDARADGSLRASVRTTGNAEGHVLAVSIRGLKDGKPLRTLQGKEQVSCPLATSGRETEFTCKWSDVKVWNTEAPELYVARLELKDRSGNVIQVREERIGFRTIEFFPQDGIYLNGTRLIVKGINRHSFSVDGGRTTSAAMSRQDALLIKEMNMNAVRSHYPPDEHFLDMCDSLGLVYIDELSGWHGRYDTETGARLIREW